MRILLVILQIVGAIEFSHAQSNPDRVELVRIKSGTRAVLNHIGRDIRIHLNISEYTTLRRIRNRIVESYSTSPFAEIRGDRRYIHFPIGLVIWAEQMAVVLQASQYTDEHGCFAAFFEESTKFLYSNTSRIKQGLKPLPASFSGAGFINHNDACRSIRHERVYNASDIERIVEAVIAHVYLHEVAHHILGHLGSQNSNVQSRRNEMAADTWAVKMAHNIDVYPILAIPILVPIIYTAGNKDSTHPTMSARILNMHRLMMEAIECDLIEWATDEHLDEARAIERTLEDMVAELRELGAE